MKKLLFLLIPIVSSLSILPVYASIEQCLTSAYPAIEKVEHQQIYFKNGTVMPIGETGKRSFMQMLSNATIADQLTQAYPLNFTVPKQYQDAGRIRSDEFFKQMYGESQFDIQQNLVAVKWKPSGKTIQFNRVNGASSALEKVGNEIANQPDLIPYVSRALGSFVYRNIAGTDRLSAHSFGIAVDFQLPKHLHKYWRWDGCTTETKICPYPSQLIADPKLNRIVQIFEKYGFIWGGKWASYDSVHFEYRPELLLPVCRNHHLTKE